MTQEEMQGTWRLAGLALAVLLLAECGGTSRTNTTRPGPPGSGPDPFQTTGGLVAARKGATATFLSTGPLAGLVLVCGGRGQDGTALSSAEFYNPATGTFTGAGIMTTPRAFHTATFMDNGPLAGDVLITGGVDALGNVLSSAEIFDSVTSSFEAVGNMFSARHDHVAVPLDFTSSSTSTYVLVAGGKTSSGSVLNSVEIFDPATQTFNGGGVMKKAREFFTGTLMSTSPASTTNAVSVLMAGGIDNSGNPQGTAELYSIGGSSTSTPFNGSSATTGTMSTARYDQAATFLTSTPNSTMPVTCSGQVLITGGLNSSATALNSAELFSAGTFTAVTAAMVNDRVFHSATLVGVNGTTEVLLAGGFSSMFGGILNSAELFNAPGTGGCSTGTFTATGGRCRRRGSCRGRYAWAARRQPTSATS